MTPEEYKEYVNLIFDNYLRKLLYAGAIIISIFLVIKYLNDGDKFLESVMVIMGVLIFGELFLQTFRWLFSKAPSLFRVPAAARQLADTKEMKKKNKSRKKKNNITNKPF
ncbi:hypothetical protein GJV85_12285 [Sulfurimonas aquatica]|uniref:Uncharacterized protein n=1 Tax=Sulfurimonas aquatica TaxID=2672570 RepID=A0A975B2C0_9BACT|nr:hypothetical protein [Sulfurimonas aquatica]QSZ42853.1 hypothetical protein GJV85_12285 [Sulfurimonas aquatica]